MKQYLRVSLFSCGFGAFLLLASFSLSGSSTVQWNGQRCLAGTQNGFPLPFLYSMDRSSVTPPLTHSTSVCSSGYNVMPLNANFSNAALDYLFWFAVSLPVAFGLNLLLIRRARIDVAKEGEAVTPDPVPAGT